MANIQPYIDQILNAVYGEEVRSSIVNALEKVNDDNNSYADLKKEVIAAKDAVDKDVDAVQQNLVMEVVKQHRQSIQKVIQELLKRQMKEL